MFTSLGKLNYMTVLGISKIKLNFIQTSVWPMFYVYQHVTGALSHKTNSPIIENGSTVQLLFQKKCQRVFVNRNNLH